MQGLGVPYETFQKFQDIAVQEAQNSTESLGKAARFLEAYGLGTSYRLTSVMLSLQKLGFDNLYDGFFQQCLEFAVHHVLRELKQHARIPIPGGWTLVGVADVHGFLKEGEIFACFKNPDSGKTVYLEGPTLISRSPTVHPGDVSYYAYHLKLSNTKVLLIRFKLSMPLENHLRAHVLRKRVFCIL